jgi:hypothetical protein
MSRLDTLREGPLPSAEIDASGRVYAVWSDCRFRTNCTSNDIIMSTSTNGTSWSAPTRVPIDAANSAADHFVPGIGVDPSSSGSTARIGLTYYYYPVASCTTSTCRLDVGFVSSSDGGSTWSAPTQVAGPMRIPWLADTSQGRMVGDYVSTSVAGGSSFPFFALAGLPASGGSCSQAAENCREALDTTATGLAAGGPPLRSTDTAVAGAHSDHAPSSTPLEIR